MGIKCECLSWCSKSNKFTADLKKKSHWLKNTVFSIFRASKQCAGCLWPYPIGYLWNIKMWFCLKKKVRKNSLKMTAESVPTSNLKGVGRRNHFHKWWFEKKLQLPNMQKVSLLFWKGVGDFVWGKKLSDGLADVLALTSFSGVGRGGGRGSQGTAVETVGRNLCRVGLSLASRMPPVYSTCWLAKVTLPLSWEPLQMSSNSTC